MCCVCVLDTVVCVVGVLVVCACVAVVSVLLSPANESHDTSDSWSTLTADDSGALVR